MLDVHPPHAPTHTWRDFFIHVGTIVIGLLIAVGLEQTVEFVHHREQIKQAREALDLERRQNIVLAQLNAVLLRREHERYSGDLASLRFIQTNSHADLKDLPAPIQWGVNHYSFRVAAWESLRGGPIAALLPPAELQTNEQLYQTIENFETSNQLLLDRIGHAARYRFTTADPRDLPPAQMDATIEATLELLTQHYKTSIYLQNLCDGKSTLGFKPCLSAAEIHSWQVKEIKVLDFPQVYGAVGQVRLEHEAESNRQLDEMEKDLNALEKQN